MTYEKNGVSKVGEEQWQNGKFIGAKSHTDFCLNPGCAIYLFSNV